MCSFFSQIVEINYYEVFPLIIIFLAIILQKVKILKVQYINNVAEK